MLAALLLWWALPVAACGLAARRAAARGAPVHAARLRAAGRTGFRAGIAGAACIAGWLRTGASGLPSAVSDPLLARGAAGLGVVPALAFVAAPHAAASLGGRAAGPALPAAGALATAGAALGHLVLAGEPDAVRTAILAAPFGAASSFLFLRFERRALARASA